MRTPVKNPTASQFAGGSRPFRTAAREADAWVESDAPADVRMAARLAVIANERFAEKVEGMNERRVAA